MTDEHHLIYFSFFIFVLVCFNLFILFWERRHLWRPRRFCSPAWGSMNFIEIQLTWTRVHWWRLSSMMCHPAILLPAGYRKKFHWNPITPIPGRNFISIGVLQNKKTSPFHNEDVRNNFYKNCPQWNKQPSYLFNSLCSFLWADWYCLDILMTIVTSILGIPIHNRSAILVLFFADIWASFTEAYWL